ncbi:unnamed protein product [Effrenium voratum]|nr:unnamed protein product [Effrenium voratum]
MEPDTAEDEGSEELPEDLLDSQDGEEGESEEQTDDEPYEDEIAEKEEEVQSEVSSVSNVMEETDSDEMPEIQRGAAQVFPEEQWRRPVQRLQRLLLSCLLPVLLALLAVYAAFRGVKLIARLIYDLYIVTRYLILLCIRIALFPFFLIWLVLPSFIQDFLFEKYEQSLGKPVKLVLRAHKAVQETITDIPDMLWACAEALYAACLLPVAQTCRSLCWLICGKNLLESVRKPRAAVPDLPSDVWSFSLDCQT